jgi:hypothetical protein
VDRRVGEEAGLKIVVREVKIVMKKGNKDLPLKAKMMTPANKLCLSFISRAG